MKKNIINELNFKVFTSNSVSRIDKENNNYLIFELYEYIEQKYGLKNIIGKFVAISDCIVYTIGFEINFPIK